MTVSPADLPVAFHNRGIRIKRSVNLAAVECLSQLTGLSMDSYILNLYREFNGFDRDFDGPSFISLWCIEDVIDELPNFRQRKLIPFADFSFRTDVYCVGSEELEERLWSELKNNWLDLRIGRFFTRWLNGDYDNELGAFFDEGPNEKL